MSSVSGFWEQPASTKCLTYHRAHTDIYICVTQQQLYVFSGSIPMRCLLTQEHTESSSQKGFRAPWTRPEMPLFDYVLMARPTSFPNEVG